MAVTPGIRESASAVPDAGSATAEHAHGDHAPRWIAGIVLLSLVLMRLPVLLPTHGRLLRLGIAAVFIVAAAAVPRREPLRFARGLATLTGLYLVLAAAAIYRGVGAGVYTTWKQPAADWSMVAALGILGLIFCASPRNATERWSRLALVSYTPTAYVAANVLLRAGRPYLGFFTFPNVSLLTQGQPDKIASLLGIHSTRITFPLAGGINNFGAIAAAGFAAAIVLWLRGPRGRHWPTLVSAAVCLYGALATDSRGPLFLSLAVIALFALLRRVRTAGSLAVLLPLSPVIALATLSFLAGSGFGGALSRGNGDIVTGNNRLYIWQTVFDFLKHPAVKQLVGYGAYGHITSGVSARYAYLFAGFPNPATYTTHNLALQTVLDSGYIGLVVLIALVLAAVRTLERAVRSEPRSAAAGVLALLLVLVLSGATEALPSYIFTDTLGLFTLAVVAAAAALPARVDESTPAKPRASL